MRQLFSHSYSQDRIGARSMGECCALCLERTRAVRPKGGEFSRHAASIGTSMDRDLCGSITGLQRRKIEGERERLRKRRCHGKALFKSSGRESERPSNRMDGRNGLRPRRHCGEDVEGQQDWCYLRRHEQYTTNNHSQVASGTVCAMKRRANCI